MRIHGLDKANQQPDFETYINELAAVIHRTCDGCGVTTCMACEEKFEPPRLGQSAGKTTASKSDGTAGQETEKDELLHCPKLQVHLNNMPRTCDTDVKGNHPRRGSPYAGTNFCFRQRAFNTSRSSLTIIKKAEENDHWPSFNSHNGATKANTPIPTQNGTGPWG